MLLEKYMCLGLGFGGLSDFPAAKSSMVLHLDTTLISPQYVSVAYPGFQRGVLKVRPHTKSGGGGGALQVGYTKSGGGGGGGGGRALQVRYTKSGGGWGGGGGGGASGPIYEKWGGGGGASDPIYEKWGGGHSASGPIPLGTQKISTCTYLR